MHQSLRSLLHSPLNATIVRRTRGLSQMKLEIPPLLRTLIESGRWSHPGDEILRREVPLLVDPVDFRTWLPRETIAREIANLFSAQDWEVFKLYRDDQPARSLP